MQYNDNIETNSTESKEEQQNNDYTNIFSFPEKYCDCLKQEGIYLISERGKDNEEENNEEDSGDNNDNEDKEEEETKYTFTPISIQEIIDYTKNPPEIKEEYQNKDIVVSRGNKIFYGDVKLKTYVEENNIKTVILPDKQGCFYENGKLNYKGYFNNGKKTFGIKYEPNGKYFFKNFKGNDSFLKHNNKDLVVYITNNIDNNQQVNEIKDKYSQYLILNLKGEGLLQNINNIKNIENIKIVVNNGYKFDYSKTHYNYIDEKGDTKKYNPKDEKKMYINTESISNTINYLINATDDCVNNIEISGLNNFGFLNNENGKNLQDEIANKILEKLQNNEINLYFRNTPNKEVSNTIDVYKNGKQKHTIVHDNKNFKIFDNKSGKWKTLSETEYIEILNKNGFYKNKIIDDDLINEEDKNSEILADIYTFKDEVLTELNRKKTILFNNLEEQESKLKKNEQEKIQQPKTTEYKSRDINAYEVFLIILAGLIIPIVGGILMYIYLTKPEINNNNDNIKQNQYNKTNEDVEKNEQKKQEEIQKKQEDNRNKRIKQFEENIEQPQQEGQNSESEKKQINNNISINTLQSIIPNNNKKMY